jgi:diazepam-binding inhibitor (GABA receptor modulating acyl-CoA-binding protein)
MSQKYDEDAIKKYFELSGKIATQMNSKLNDNEKLFLYGLYKQVTLGDCTTQEPSIINFTENRKWKAWKKNINMNKILAMDTYANFVSKLIDKYNVEKN